jgi:dCMP deaminase
MGGRDLVALAYVPVLHEGYRRFFKKLRDAGVEELYIIGSELAGVSDYLRKEIRALDPELMVKAVRSLGIFSMVSVATEGVLIRWNANGTSVVMPDEDICRSLAEKLIPNCRTEFEAVFLRWDRTNTVAEHLAQPHRTITVTELDREFLGRALEESRQASGWWRQVGAVLVRDREMLIVAHNRHVPSPHMPYTNGDPRNAFKKGVNIELGTELHAEKGVICKAAREGIRTEGTYLYASTFPCPPCAKAIAYSGIARCYFSEGYAMLDGESILKSQGVEVIHVPL